MYTQGLCGTVTLYFNNFRSVNSLHVVVSVRQSVCLSVCLSKEVPPWSIWAPDADTVLCLSDIHMTSSWKDAKNWTGVNDPDRVFFKVIARTFYRDPGRAS